MDTIPQNDHKVPTHVLLRESVRRHLKAEAAKAGVTIGDYIEHLLTQHAGYKRPKTKEKA